MDVPKAWARHLCVRGASLPCGPGVALFGIAPHAECALSCRRPASACLACQTALSRDPHRIMCESNHAACRVGPVYNRHRGDVVVANVHVAIRSEELRDLCRRYHVHSLALFGSVLRDDFRTDSEVYLVVEFEPKRGCRSDDAEPHAARAC